MIHLFCGFDPRESVGFHTFVSSVLKRASQPVSIVPLSTMGLPEGTNNFTVSRFLVPHLMGHQGRAIFMDACDMICLGDIADLYAEFDESKAIQVVKHPEYQSQHARKYVGTDMECEQSNYARKNWASVMLFNCGHPAWWHTTPAALAKAPTLDLLTFADLDDADIGELAPAWNVMVDEGQDDADAKILHWTAGIPTFRHYRNARRSIDWFEEHKAISRGMQDGR